MRNNEKRLGMAQRPAHATSDISAVVNQTPLAYVVPTEFVELPSRGQFYPREHRN